MCITLDPAILSSTILLAHQIEHEGKMVNVVGYQNHAKSNSSGPNAMILPIPSAAPMSPANCIDMTGVGDLFTEYEELLRPRSRGIDSVAVASGPAFDDLQVFESGNYTVLLTKQVNLTGLRAAMEALPEDKRIELDFPKAKIFSSYRKLYPDWHIAICIWNEDIVKAEPILWWYEPMPEYVDKHFLPGLDAHDGNPPDPSLQSVRVDHTLVVGMASLTIFGRLHSPNAESLVAKVPEHLRKWLPTNVTGALLQDRQMLNGDWTLPKEGWGPESPNYNALRERVSPPGYTG